MTYRHHHAMRAAALLPLVAAFMLLRAGSDTDAIIPDQGMAVPGDTPAAALAVPAKRIANLPPIFMGTIAATADSVSDAVEPQLIGIAGRLPDDVEVLLRMADGTTRSLRIGESAGGWSLVSAKMDSAVFTDNQRRIVLTMAAPS